MADDGGPRGAVAVARVVGVGPADTIEVVLGVDDRITRSVRPVTLFGLRGPWSAAELAEVLDEVEPVLVEWLGQDAAGRWRVAVTAVARGPLHGPRAPTRSATPDGWTP